MKSKVSQKLIGYIAIPVILLGITTILLAIFSGPHIDKIIAKTIRGESAKYYQVPIQLDHIPAPDTSCQFKTIAFGSNRINVVGPFIDSFSSEKSVIRVKANDITYEIKPTKIEFLLKTYRCHKKHPIKLFNEDYITFVDKIMNIPEKPRPYFRGPKEFRESIKRENFILCNSFLNEDKATKILKTSYQHFLSYQFGEPKTNTACPIYIIYNNQSLQIRLSTRDLSNPNWNQKSIDAIIGSIRLQ